MKSEKRKWMIVPIVVISVLHRRGLFPIQMSPRLSPVVLKWYWFAMFLTPWLKKKASSTSKFPQNSWSHPTDASFLPSSKEASAKARLWAGRELKFPIFVRWPPYVITWTEHGKAHYPPDSGVGDCCVVDRKHFQGVVWIDNYPLSLPLSPAWSDAVGCVRESRILEC